MGEQEAIWTPSVVAAEGQDVTTELGTLRVTGTVRGGRLSANRLVHIPGYGDFTVAEVRSDPVIFLLTLGRSRRHVRCSGTSLVTSEPGNLSI